MTEVKGVIIASTPKIILDKFGQYGLKKWLELISPAARRIYTSDINPEAWFPLKDMLIEPMANIAQLFYDWDLKRAAWDFGRLSADSRTPGVFKFLARFPKSGSPIEKTVENISAHYRPCTISVPMSDQKYCLVRVSLFPEMDKTTEFRICGWIERSMEIGGCKNVKLKINKSLTSFQPVSEYDLRWD